MADEALINMIFTNAAVTVALSRIRDLAKSSVSFTEFKDGLVEILVELEGSNAK